MYAAGSAIFRLFHPLKVMLLVLLLLSCYDLPTNPDNATNSNVWLSLKSTTGLISEQQVSDTVGNDIEIIVALRYPQYIKKIIVQVLASNDSIEDDTTLVPMSKKYQDTIRFTNTFSVPGGKKVVATAFIEDNLQKSDTALMTLINRVIVKQEIINHKPWLVIDGNTLITADQTCSLSVMVNDSDAQQVHNINVWNKGQGIVVSQRQFTWKPVTGFIGKDTLMFIATDNGSPILSDTVHIVVDVAEKKPSSPLHLRITSRTVDSVKLAWEKTARAMDYVLYRSDNAADGYKILKDSLISFNFSDSIGSSLWYYYVKARNSAGLSDSSNVISSKDTGNITPKWDIDDTLKVDLNAGATYSLNLKDTCFDSNGDSLQFMLFSGAPAADTIINNVYSFSSTNVDTGKSIVKIVAKDQGNLTDTLIIKLTLKLEIAGDTTRPAMFFKNPSTGAVKIADTSTTIQISCTDANGIASVTCTQNGGKTISVTNTDSVYSAVVHGFKSGRTDTITFVATDNSTAHNKNTLQLIIACDPSMNDKVGPVITLQTPAKDSTKVSSSTFNIAVKCADDNGIYSVTSAFGGKSVAVTKGTGDIYTAIFSGLVIGANQIIFEATDSSTNANKTTDTLTIIYDPTMSDNSPPIMSYKFPSSASGIVADTLTTVQISCTDDNGITSVTCTQNGGKTISVTNADSVYSAVVHGLKAGKIDTITFVATDNSTAHNKATLQLTITTEYTDNRKPAVTTAPVSLPCNGTVTITFTGTDPDGDALSNWQITKGPLHGTQVASPVLPAILYTPNPDYTGNDTILYTVSDGKLTSDIGTLIITMTPVLPKPQPPVISTITPGNASALVSWGAVNGATSYNLFYRISSTVDTTNGTKVANAISPQQVTGLTNSSAYAFVVTAVNANGQSAPSEVRTATPQVPVAGAPTLNAPSAGVGKVTLTWTAISGATMYNLYYHPGNISQFIRTSAIKVPVTTGLTFEISTLTNCQEYSFGITSVNDGGESNISALQSATPVGATPTIGTPPAATLSTCEGVAVSISVTATVASGTLIYQWSQNGTPILLTTNSTADKATLLLTNPVLGDAGTYSCAIKTTCSSIAPSGNCVLTVNAKPSVTPNQPTSKSANENTPVSITVVATGAPTLTYQWKKGGLDVLNAITETYTIQSAKPADAGTYTCVVSNGCAPAVTCAPITLTVIAIPTIQIQPQPVSANKGGTVSLSVTAQPSGVTYAWYKRNGTGNVVSTSNPYQMTNLDYVNAGNYYVTVSNLAGSVTSNPDVAVTVNDNVRPVLTLSGASDITIPSGTAWTDPKCTATDDKDGDITSRVISSSNPLINYSNPAVGVYTITYSVTDAASNSATTVSRTVRVVGWEQLPDMTVNKASFAGANGDIYMAIVEPVATYTQLYKLNESSWEMKNGTIDSKNFAVLSLQSRYKSLPLIISGEYGFGGYITNEYHFKWDGSALSPLGMTASTGLGPVSIASDGKPYTTCIPYVPYGTPPITMYSYNANIAGWESVNGVYNESGNYYPTFTIANNGTFYLAGLSTYYTDSIAVYTCTETSLNNPNRYHSSINAKKIQQIFLDESTPQVPYIMVSNTNNLMMWKPGTGLSWQGFEIYNSAAKSCAFDYSPSTQRFYSVYIDATTNQCKLMEFNGSSWLPFPSSTNGVVPVTDPGTGPMWLIVYQNRYFVAYTKSDGKIGLSIFKIN